MAFVNVLDVKTKQTKSHRTQCLLLFSSCQLTNKYQTYCLICCFLGSPPLCRFYSFFLNVFFFPSLACPLKLRCVFKISKKKIKTCIFFFNQSQANFFHCDFPATGRQKYGKGNCLMENTRVPLSVDGLVVSSMVTARYLKELCVRSILERVSSQHLWLHSIFCSMPHTPHSYLKAQAKQKKHIPFLRGHHGTPDFWLRVPSRFVYFTASDKGSVTAGKGK